MSPAVADDHVSSPFQDLLCPQLAHLGKEQASGCTPGSIPSDQQNGIQTPERSPDPQARQSASPDSTTRPSPTRSGIYSSPSFPYLPKDSAVEAINRPSAQLSKGPEGHHALKRPPRPCLGRHRDGCAAQHRWPKQALQLDADSRWDVHPTSSWVGKSRAVRIHRSSCAVIACPPGEVLSPEELPRPRENSWLEGCIAVLSMGLLFGFAFVLPVVALVSLYSTIRTGSLLGILFLSLLAVELFAPLSKVWFSFRHWTLWDIWRRYFRLCVIIPPMPVLTPGKHYLVCQFPHCVFPMGCWLTSCVIEHWTTGGTYVEAAVASVLFKLPFVRHVFAWIGCHPADRSVILRMLGVMCVAILPEGLAGIVRGANPAHERVAMLGHKGFCSVAIQAGTDILPVYHMGNSQLLSFRGWPWLSRKLRAMVGVFWGRWCLPIPRQHDMITLVGSPIPVQQNDSPTQAEVEALHQQVQDAIAGLYARHRHLLPGWQTRPLQIC